MPSHLPSQIQSLPFPPPPLPKPRLRARGRPPPHRYAASFTAVEALISAYADHERRVGFREIISSGASGSYFYFTPDRNYVVKTLSRAEKNALIDLVPHYLEHCRRHPGTLIRYIGCHSIRLPLNTCKVYFVVMANVMPPMKPHMTFDLKGATSNRQRARGQQLAELLMGTRSPASFKTLLDIDYSEDSRAAHTPPPRRPHAAPTPPPYRPHAAPTPPAPPPRRPHCVR